MRSSVLCRVLEIGIKCAAQHNAAIVARKRITLADVINRQALTGQVEGLCQAELVALQPIGSFFIATVVFVTRPALHEQTVLITLQIGVKGGVALIDQQVAQQCFAYQFLLNVLHVQAARVRGDILCIGQHQKLHVDAINVIGFHV